MVSVFAYKLNGKWRISPDYEQERAWLFTKNDDPITDKTKWYTFGHVMESKDSKVIKKKFRVLSNFKMHGLKNSEYPENFPVPEQLGTEEICKHNVHFDLD